MNTSEVHLQTLNSSRILRDLMLFSPFLDVVSCYVIESSAVARLRTSVGWLYVVAIWCFRLRSSYFSRAAGVPGDRQWAKRGTDRSHSFQEKRTKANISSYIQCVRRMFWRKWRWGIGVRRVQGVSILNEEVQEGLSRFEKGRREEWATQLAGRPPRQRAPRVPEPQAEAHWHSEGNMYISSVARPKHSLWKQLFQFPLILSVFCSWWFPTLTLFQNAKNKSVIYEIIYYECHLDSKAYWN